MKIWRLTRKARRLRREIVLWLRSRMITRKPAPTITLTQMVDWQALHHREIKRIDAECRRLRVGDLNKTAFWLWPPYGPAEEFVAADSGARNNFLSNAYGGNQLGMQQALIGIRRRSRAHGNLYIPLQYPAALTWSNT